MQLFTHESAEILKNEKFKNPTAGKEMYNPPKMEMDCIIL